MRQPPPLRPPGLDLAGAAGATPALVGQAPARIAPSRPAIDPRIIARRIAVRRSEGRKRLHRLLWVGGAVALVLGAVASTRTPLLDLDHVQVRGTERLPDDTVVAVAEAAGLSLGRPLTDVDLHAAATALEGLPQVASVQLRRRWPGTVQITITEREPVGTLPVYGGTALVASDGVVITVTPTGSDPAASALVPLAGPPTLAPGDRFEADGVLAVAGALPEVLAARVATVAPGEGDDTVDLHLREGGIVRLGAADQLGAKLVAAETVLAQVDTTCLATLDVRVPSSPTVTRRAGCR